MAKGATLTNDQKREWAQVLYVQQRLSQKEIAAKVQTSENTVSKWKDKFNWDGLRKSILVTKSEQLRRLYDQLNFLTQTIEERPHKVATSAEADIISKLTKAIESLETEISLAEIIEVGQKFLEFVRQQDLTKAQELTGYYDAFIQSSLK